MINHGVAGIKEANDKMYGNGAKDLKPTGVDLEIANKYGLKEHLDSQAQKQAKALPSDDNSTEAITRRREQYGIKEFAERGEEKNVSPRKIQI
jgi:hypothetical protein